VPDATLGRILSELEQATQRIRALEARTNVLQVDVQEATTFTGDKAYRGIIWSGGLVVWVGPERSVSERRAQYRKANPDAPWYGDADDRWIASNTRDAARSDATEHVCLAVAWLLDAKFTEAAS
jgi:hypothetical protein